MLGNKKAPPESEPLDLTDHGSGARAFTLPPFFVEKDFFGGFPLFVSDGEYVVIRRLDEKGRRQYIVSGIVGLMKVAEMSIILADEGASLLYPKIFPPIFFKTPPHDTKVSLFSRNIELLMPQVDFVVLICP